MAVAQRKLTQAQRQMKQVLRRKPTQLEALVLWRDDDGEQTYSVFTFVSSRFTKESLLEALDEAASMRPEGFVPGFILSELSGEEHLFSMDGVNEDTLQEYIHEIREQVLVN